MPSEAQPLVSVVTPFYNTARYLEQCIESVLRQAYGRFEYILLDNCSTDGSGEIAARYAAQDSRIRYIKAADFLGQVQNYNFALAQIDAASRYCKLVQADDWIYPQCLQEMVAVAERAPTIGLVGAYSLRGTRLVGEGLPVDQWLIPGPRAARLQMVENRFFVGSPTTVLYRSDIVRQRRPFYEPGRYHEDTETAYEILRRHDLGFVHQVLSYQRVEANSTMGQRESYQPHLLDRLIVLERYGKEFLEPAELTAALRQAEQRLIRLMGGALLRRRGADFWKYQADGYASMHRPLPKARIALSACDQLLDVVLNPRNTLRGLLSRVGERLRRR